MPRTRIAKNLVNVPKKICHMTLVHPSRSLSPLYDGESSAVGRGLPSSFRKESFLNMVVILSKGDNQISCWRGY